VDRARNQARIPILSPIEMANQDEASVVSHILAAGYGPRLKTLFGEFIFMTRFSRATCAT
jgi:cytochrome c peroxidase